MALGKNLSSRQVLEAIAYNKARFRGDHLKTVRKKLGLAESGGIDEDFVRTAADWQEANLGAGQGDGKVGPATEGALNILLPAAQKAVDAIVEMLKKGGVLFDSWGNDLRDNNSNGKLDWEDPQEKGAQDGEHLGGVYKSFRVRAGTYEGGWSFARKTVTVSADKEITGTFRYLVCADVISRAYEAAGVMKHVRATGAILEAFRSQGIVWTRSVSYPTKYLPGDFISTYAAGHGHSAIVVEESDTNGGSSAPMVIDLPGPSTQISDGTYDPTSTNDIQKHRWSQFRIDEVAQENQFLGRLLGSKFRGT
jgi:hypothetical protein